MPRPKLTIDVPDVYDQRSRATEAAQGIDDMIGDQPGLWAISVSEACNQPGWRVEVICSDKCWVHTFDGLDQSAEKIVEQFRLDLSPYV